MHEEDVLGKAYDGRLDAAAARLPASVPASGRDRRHRHHRPLLPRAGPAVPDEDRHRPLHPGARRLGAGPDGGALPDRPDGLVHPRIHPDLDDAGDRAADHVRHADADDRAPAAARSALLRSQPGRPADDAGHDRCGRAQRSVHVGRGVGIRRRLYADRHHGGAGLDGLAPGARGVFRAAADCGDHAVVPRQRPRDLPRRSHLDRAHQCLSCRSA